MLGKVKIAVWDTKGNLAYENDQLKCVMMAAIEKLEGQTSVPALMIHAQEPVLRQHGARIREKGHAQGAVPALPRHPSA